MLNLSERIKELRAFTGLSQEKFAEKIGLSRSTLALIETNKTLPGYDALYNICTEFNVLPTYFFDNGKVDLKTYIDAAKWANKRGEQMNLDLGALMKLGGDYQEQLAADLNRQDKNLLELFRVLIEMETLILKLADYWSVIGIEDLSKVDSYVFKKSRQPDITIRHQLPNNHPVKIGFEEYKKNILNYLHTLEPDRKNIISFHKRLADFINDIDHLVPASATRYK